MSAEATLAQFQAWTAFAYPGTAVLDTETTDLDGEIIELAIVTVDGEVLFDERIRPRFPISAGAQAVHGITDADLADRPDFVHFWPRIRRLICERQILVYNRDFDFQVLFNSLRAVNPAWYKGDPASGDPYTADYWALTQARQRAQCVMQAYAPLAGHWTDWGGYRWAKLADACAARGVDLGDVRPHSAVGDALATARLVRACAALEPGDFSWIGREAEVFG